METDKTYYNASQLEDAYEKVHDFVILGRCTGKREFLRQMFERNREGLNERQKRPCQTT